MGACKDCKYWGMDYDGVCSFVNTIKATANPDTIFELKLTADDDQGLEGHLVTGPYFGCIHFLWKINSMSNYLDKTLQKLQMY